MRLLARWLASTLALLLVAWIIPNIHVEDFFAALLAALVIGLVNSVLGTILKFLTAPINCLTLGLFSLVINAFLFWVASQIVVGFDVVGALAAIFGALLYGLTAAAISALIGVKE